MGIILIFAVIGAILLGCIIYRIIAWKQYDKWRHEWCEVDGCINPNFEHNKNNMSQQEYTALVKKQYKKWDKVTESIGDTESGRHITEIAFALICAAVIVFCSISCIIKNSPEMAETAKQNLNAERQSYIEVYNREQKQGNLIFTNNLRNEILNFDNNRRFNQKFNHNFWVGWFISDEVASVPPTGIFDTEE